MLLPPILALEDFGLQSAFEGFRKNGVLKIHGDLDRTFIFAEQPNFPLEIRK